jgi:hypothetical protein
MTPFKLAIESFKIDKLEKKWVARYLFLLVYFLNAVILFFEPGNSDFSAIQAWAEKYSQMTSVSPMQVIEYPPITIGHFIYIGSILALILIDILASNLYMRIYIGDRSGQSTSISALWFLKRLPVLIVFIAFVSGALFVIVILFQGILRFTSILPLLSIFYAFLAFIPPILLFDRKLTIQAIVLGFLRTKGKRIFLFLSSTVLFIVYMLSETMISLLLYDYREASVLLVSLTTTILILTLGRMTGIIYEHVYLKANANESKN